MHQVAVVHESVDVSGLLAELLEEMDWETVHLPTVSALQAALQTDVPDAVLLSTWVDGPGQGWEVFRQLRSDERTASLPIILWPEHERECEQALKIADAHIVVIRSTLHIDDLCRALQQVLPN